MNMVGHFKEMLSLVRLLTNHNATYNLKASDNDIFVTCSCKDEEGNERYCSRLKYVNEAIEEGKTIQIISFEELLTILGVTEEDLSSMPFPDESAFYKKPRQKKKTPKIEKPTSKGPTLGDLFPELFEKLKNELPDD